MLSGHKASDFMSTDLVLLTPDMDLTRAMGLLVEHDVSGAPVLDTGGALVGLLTEKDCFRALFRANYYRELVGTVGDHMSAPVEVVQADADVLAVVELLYRSRFRRFPVVAGERLVGLLSRSDVLRAVQALWQPGDLDAGCVAYAPVVDVRAHWGAELVAEIEQELSGFEAFVRRSSPVAHVTRLKRPVFLCYAEDDGAELVEGVRDFGATLKRKNRRVAISTVEDGGHCDAMIEVGVPRALQWMDRTASAAAKSKR